MLFMTSGGNVAKQPSCVVTPSHPKAISRKNGSVCHVDTVERPKIGWNRQERLGFYFSSIVRVGDEIMVVIQANATRVGDLDGCRLIVSRESPRRHPAGANVLSPTHLDVAATETNCEEPPQYALDYLHPGAATCLQRHIEHAFSVGFDGTWFDNMGPNVFGAKTSNGIPIGSYDLRYPDAISPEPCPTNMNEVNKIADPEQSTSVVHRFKLCRFGKLIEAQDSRVTLAMDAVRKAKGRRPLVFGNGLKHSFYWSDIQAAYMRDLYLDVMRAKNKTVSNSKAPFAKNMSEDVVYFKCRGTSELMEGQLDGFNMESFFGFITVSRLCRGWPIGRNITLENCGANLHYPGPAFWHANVRVFADAGRRGLKAMAKVGQAGWKSVAQEYLHPAALHRWTVSAYASFLLTVGGAQHKDRLMFGIHPFAQTSDGSVQPWLHPVFFLDLGKPIHTFNVLEEYSVDGHPSYVRRFEHGIVLYNPYPTIDDHIPLGGEYVDPWAEACEHVKSWTLDGQTGTVLVRQSSLLSGPAR